MVNHLLDKPVAQNLDCPWTETDSPVEFQGPNCTVSFTPAKGPLGKKFVLARRWGPLYLADIKAIAPQEMADPRYDSMLPYLWDLRGHDFSMYDPEQERASSAGLSVVSERKWVKKASLVSSEVGFGIMRMFEGMAAGRNHFAESYYLTTYDPLEAVMWLDV